MSKLRFYYGTMNSSKSALGLMMKFNYEQKGMRVLLIKPGTDTRSGEGFVSSRVGLSSPAACINENDIISEKCNPENYDVVIVDECQFFTEKQIDELRSVVDKNDIPVLCFGLRTDFRTKLFPGSRRLFEIADSFEELKSVCSCGRKSIFNARVSKDMFGNCKIQTEGDVIDIGAEDKYETFCSKCFYDKLRRESD